MNRSLKVKQKIAFCNFNGCFNKAWKDIQSKIDNVLWNCPRQFNTILALEILTLDTCFSLDKTLLKNNFCLVKMPQISVSRI